MNNLDLIRSLAIPSDSKIIFIVMDGLGGLPHTETGKTELETARTPNLDRLAARGICGLIDMVSPGITPGSAPGHLALFGYDPLEYNIGRGVLETTGIEFDFHKGDVAARGNFCTVDASSLITDRRAGRISTEICTELCKLLDGQKIDNVEILVSPVKEHRFVIVLRGENLRDELNDSDPQQTGVAPRPVTSKHSIAGETANIVNKFIDYAGRKLADNHPANMILLRGFSRLPDITPMSDIYLLKPAAIASYPMYRGLAKLVGMDILPTGSSIEDEFNTLRQNYDRYDYFFLHVKGTDSAGEDGDFARKVRVIEAVDEAVSALPAGDDDVIIVTGDHSTPAILKGHSWHPVPAVLYSKWCRPDQANEFSERACVGGGLGQLKATHLMTFAMAHALKLTKYGA